jgi:hypothetical protein
MRVTTSKSLMRSSLLLSLLLLTLPARSNFISTALAPDTPASGHFRDAGLIDGGASGWTYARYSGAAITTSGYTDGWTQSDEIRFEDYPEATRTYLATGGYFDSATYVLGISVVNTSAGYAASNVSSY